MSSTSRSLVLPHVAKGTHSGLLRIPDRLGLILGSVAIVNGLFNGWFWLSAVGILVVVVALFSWWRTRAQEPTTAFEIREDGLVVDGILRPFTSIVSARRTTSATGILTTRRASLWLEFGDGTNFGIGYWIANFAEIQAAVIERLPAEVRARILADSKLVE